MAEPEAQVVIRRVRVDSESDKETRHVAAAVATIVRPGDVVALVGDLGAGKTCFVRGLAEGLGLDPRQVSSPTFVICQEYNGDDRAPLVHLDVYRLHGADELHSFGFDELLSVAEAVVVIEWADRITAELPADRLTVELEHSGASSRRLTITGPARLIEPLGDRLAVAVEDPSVACPICGRRVNEGAGTFPFCSPRCQLVDLGRWFDGNYRIQRPLEPSDEL